MPIDLMIIGWRAQNWHICALPRPAAVRTVGAKNRRSEIVQAKDNVPVYSGA
jgi:hypothetical protein